jgi:hypothetical protein
LNRYKKALGFGDDGPAGDGHLLRIFRLSLPCNREQRASWLVFGTVSAKVIIVPAGVAFDGANMWLANSRGRVNVIK